MVAKLGFYSPPTWSYGSFGTTDLNSSTLKSGAFFRSIGKQITKVRLNFASVATPPVYQVSLQGLSAKVTPSGTDLGGGSPTLTTFTPVAGSQDITLTNAYTPTLGDDVAIVVEYSSGTIGASNHAVLNIRIGTNTAQNPGILSFNGTSWTGTSGQQTPTSAIHSDGSLPLYMGTITAISSIDFNNASTTKEYGIHFIPDVNYSINNLLVQTAGNAGNGKLTIYDGSNTVLTGSDNVTTTQTDYNGSPTEGWCIVPITSLTLSAGSDYYLAYSPTSASNIRVRKITFADQAGKEAIFGSANFVQRNTIGSGAWTEDAASFCEMSLFSNGLSGSGGGSSYTGFFIP